MQVAALYQFTPFEDPARLREELLELCNAQGICGTLLLAHEGINGTIAGEEDRLAVVIDHIRSLPGCADLGVRYSHSDEPPFMRMKVRLKKEIVTLGVGEIDVEQQRGEYVDPQQWNALIDDPDTLVIDTRNDYEIAIGSFRGAINPQTQSFRDFPAWFDQFSKAIDGTETKIAMFCTGGIRCEKATAWVRSRGFDNVYHLKGGVLEYLDRVAEDDSRFEGSCFVFDQRIGLESGLQQSALDICHGCRHPLDQAARNSPEYEAGVSCPHCHDQRSEAEKQRYRERWRQVCLARERGEKHLGGN